MCGFGLGDAAVEFGRNDAKKKFGRKSRNWSNWVEIGRNPEAGSGRNRSKSSAWCTKPGRPWQRRSSSPGKAVFWRQPLVTVSKRDLALDRQPAAGREKKEIFLFWLNELVPAFTNFDGGFTRTAGEVPTSFHRGDGTVPFFAS